MKFVKNNLIFFSKGATISNNKTKLLNIKPRGIMDVNKIEPFVRNFLKGKTDKKNKEDMMCYDSTLYYVIGGRGAAHVNDILYPLSTGSFVYIPSGVRHCIVCREELEPLSFFKLSFDFSYAGATRNEPIAPVFPASYDALKQTEKYIPAAFAEPIVIQHLDTLANQFSEFYNEYQSRHELFGSYGRLSALLKNMLIVAVRMTKFNVDRKNNLAHDVVSYIDSHLEEPLNNNSIASVFGYHPYYLTRVLKDEIGMTPHKYLMKKRCDKAKELLLFSDHTIDLIGQMAGFTSQSHFAAAFRSMTGMSPTEYRRRTLSPDEKECTAENK